MPTCETCHVAAIAVADTARPFGTRECGEGLPAAGSLIAGEGSKGAADIRGRLADFADVLRVATGSFKPIGLAEGSREPVRSA
jgi:hypothetical protein